MDWDSWFFTRWVPGLALTICNKIPVLHTGALDFTCSDHWVSVNFFSDRQGEVNFSLFFFIFILRVWLICHFFIINNTNSQHFQGLYFVSISTAEGPLILPSVNQSLLQMSLLNELLSSLLQVGQLYAQQGAVREAFRQFVDGLTLAKIGRASCRERV